MIEAELAFAEHLEDIMQVQKLLSLYIKKIQVYIDQVRFAYRCLCLGDGGSYQVYHSRRLGNFSGGYSVCAQEEFCNP